VEKNDHRSFYTEEATGYEATRYGSPYGRLFRAAHLKTLDEVLEPAQQVLDVASGTGQLLPALVKFGQQVVAIDLTPGMLEESRKRHAHESRITYAVGDASRLPYPDHSFDIVASARFLHLFEPDRQAAFIAEMARVLRPGGLLVVDFYSSDARRLFWLPITLYRTLARKRPENDYRVDLAFARKTLADLGLRPVATRGLGNFLMLPLLWLPLRWQVGLAVWLGKRLPQLSEQFLMAARKP
jgi:SAM-dependent methyltransferase